MLKYSVRQFVKMVWQHICKRIVQYETISMCLPYTYNTKNSQEVAEELAVLPIKENMRIITLYIKDMYVNLPITGTIKITRFWLNKHNNNK
jgi:hypothetical protein